MEIGRPIRTVTVEPIADPVPRERPLVPPPPAPAPAPVRTSARPCRRRLRTM